MSSIQMKTSNEKPKSLQLAACYYYKLSNKVDEKYDEAEARAARLWNRLMRRKPDA